MSEIIYDGEIRMRMNDYRGLSAYEIAVQNGFDGTEAEWLESLKGPPGVDGDEITVNRVKAVDGNIFVSATDIPVQRGSAVSVKQKLDELSGGGWLTGDMVVNDLTSGGTTKVLSAEQGAELNRIKTSGFGAKMQIPIGNWEGDGPYTRDIGLKGVLANVDVCHVLMSYDPAYKEQFEDCGVVLMGQKKDALTTQVEYLPEEGFPVNVLVLITGPEEEASA